MWTTGCQHNFSKWGEREKDLFAQLTFLQLQAQVEAQKYQEKLKKYMTDRSEECQAGDHEILKLTLHRKDNLLGFKIIGGEYDQTSPGGTGIFVSHVTKGGPSDREDGLQIQDRLVEVGTFVSSRYPLEIWEM